MDRWTIKLENKIAIVAGLQRSQFSNMPWNYLLVRLPSTKKNGEIHNERINFTYYNMACVFCCMVDTVLIVHNT
jgi:hypothetical protein